MGRSFIADGAGGFILPYEDIKTWAVEVSGEPLETYDPVNDGYSAVEIITTLGNTMVMVKIHCIDLCIRLRS